MLFDLVLIGLAFALGGVLKGATGAGGAIAAVPIITALYDVQLAVAVFALPNIVSNVLQIWTQWRHRLDAALLLQFVVAGGIGAAIGTFMLKVFSSELLELMVSCVLVLYIGFRLMRPDWYLSHKLAQAIATPIGFIAGILQGASGLSGPVSITFLNAMKLERRQFIASISIFFFSSGMVQLPLLVYFGLLDFERMQLGLAGLVAVVAFMPVGAALAKRMNVVVFDKIILGMLGLIALKLSVTSVMAFLS